MNRPQMACPVCEIIIQICAADFDEYDAEILGPVSDILSSDCLHAKSVRDAANFDRPLADFPNRLLAIQKRNKETAARFGLAEETQDGEIIFDNVSTTALELVAQDAWVDHPGRALLPDSKWIDLDLVRKWISMCQSEHQNECHEPPCLKGVERVDPELLIDVVEACVAPPPSRGVSYVALSYTWGLGRNLKNIKATKQELRQPGALNLPQFASQLPETIRNTMGLVRCLGERYLWVDALCIIQDDPASLSRNLNQMQLLYANSTFNIMATEGCGAEFGLRGIEGVSRPRNLEMRVYKLANDETLCARPLSMDPTAGTKFSYHQRGWTFQEWIFSRRRLVFQHGLLKWECQCASWQEHLKANPLADMQWRLHSRNKEETLAPSPSIWDFMPIASKFNTKALTIAKDAPKAFAGIQAMLHRVHPGGLLFGLSEFFFEISLAWSSLYSNIERRGSPQATPLEHQLPSWSWLGWEGDITFPYDAEFRLTEPWHYQEQKIGFLEPVADWFCTASPNLASRRQVRSEWHRYKTGVANDFQSLPRLNGWTRQRHDLESYPYDFIPSGASAQDVYKHRSSAKHAFRYPVPILNWEDTPSLSEQMKYLFCATSRAYVKITKDTSILQVRDFERRIHIKDKDHLTITSLTLPNTKRAKEFIDKANMPRNLELIAFARGWSTWLGDDIMKNPGAEGGLNNLVSQPLRVRGTDARACYFVLWVELVDGISYRLACGEALASWWEDNKESRAAEVILG